MNTPRNVPAKPPLTLDAQIARLRERGMRVPDDDRARHYLGHLNYYRLRGYWMGQEPPVWAVCEVLSLGDLSKWLISIRDRKLRAAIAQPCGLNETVLCSFAHHLTYVRNVCAHHARLWNRPLVVGTWALPKKPETLVVQLQRAPEASQRIYNTLVMLAWLMRIISPGSEWRHRIYALVDERPDLWGDMGFPAAWHGFELWREVAP